MEEAGATLYSSWMFVEQDGEGCHLLKTCWVTVATATLWLRHCADFLFFFNGTYKGSQGLGPTRGAAHRHQVWRWPPSRGFQKMALMTLDKSRRRPRLACALDDLATQRELQG